ncbi:MAG: response regulator, partial [Bryobacteraceae bacterium]
MDRLSDLLIDFEDAPDLITLRGLAGQRVILIGFDKARSHGVATALARLKCLTRTVSYTEVYPENPDLALADVVVLHWSNEIKGSAWDRPGFVSGHWPSTSPPLIIAGQRQAMNAVPLPAPSAQFDFFELGDDSTIVRAIQECLVKMDDKNSGPFAEAAIRVLAIDDDPEMRQLIRTLLDSLGFQSFFAYDGRPGVKMARRIMPNLILLDINMPGANGFDVLSAIRQEPGT